MTRLFALALLAATVVSAACGSSSSYGSSTPSAPTTSAPTTSADVTINIQGNNGAQSFSPNPSTMRVGQRVAWRNADSITHNATQDAGSFQTGNISPGATSAPVTMSTAGTFPYRCTIHPGMVGTITVQ
jgi:plastocyanin